MILRLGLLDRARGPHRPAKVAEVPAHLTADGRHRVAEEVVAALGVEPLDRLDETDVRDLLEVVGPAMPRPRNRRVASTAIFMLRHDDPGLEVGALGRAGLVDGGRRDASWRRSGTRVRR